ncbi:MAG: hypothetical protein HYZ15_08410 [Sphingobacteriales bacterium]|nr:hypothetical protein [Sphingobacteriales bacterium]
MKHLVFSFFLIVFSCFSGVAQKADLMVKSGEKGLYLEHKVIPRESFFSVGRLYNVHPKHIATFNKLDLGKGLLIDQRLRIPLTDTNFTQKGNSGTPVYYKPAAATTLATVSKENNQVPVSSLRGWNNLSGDEVRKDSKLVIGFLLSREMPSVTLKPKQPVEPVVAKVEKLKEPEPVAEEKTTEKPAGVPENKPNEKKEEKPIPPVVTEPVSSAGQGFFKIYFEQQVKKSPVSKDETVTAGIFKTTSGWQDEKYYLLIDGASPGTIIRITNPSNNKTIYAKVLGEMNGIRQNEGYTIRVSNAAAAVLQISDTDKFIVRINY